MSWKRLLADRRVERRKTEKQELDDLRVKLDGKLRHVSLRGRQAFLLTSDSASPMTLPVSAL